MRAVSAFHQDCGAGIRRQLTFFELGDEFEFVAGKLPELRQRP
jgi:hypothetical protein